MAMLLLAISSMMPVLLILSIIFNIIRRVVFWNDANGSAFVLSNVGNEGIESHPLVVEDCTVLF